MNKEEFCIMDNFAPFYSNKRFPGSERHEIFEGRTGNRDKSIEDGLVIFTTPELHRTSKNSIHSNPKQWLWLKRKGQLKWCEYYNKTEDEFRQKYGRSYL